MYVLTNHTFAAHVASKAIVFISHVCLLTVHILLLIFDPSLNVTKVIRVTTSWLDIILHRQLKRH